MTRGKNLDALRELEKAVLDEVVREGEAMLQAQFAAATASDQRAIAWVSVLITLTVAAIGVTVSFALGGENSKFGIPTGLLSILFAISAFIAAQIFRPKLFALPGNCPENWLPSEWETDTIKDIKQARIEQARCLSNQIYDNAEWAKTTAKKLRISIDLTIISIIIVSILVCAFATSNSIQIKWLWSKLSL